MSNKKISELDQAGALTGTETAVVVQGGTTVRTVLNAIKSLFFSDLASDANGKGAALVSVEDAAGFFPATVTQTEQALAMLGSSHIVSIKDPRFNAVGDGIADDTAAVEAAEASTATHIDLRGLTVRTTLLYSAITKNYYNGTLLTLNASGNTTYQKPAAPLSNLEIARPQDKSPLLDWAGKKVLWLGTSIPVEGGTDAYPFLFGNALQCDVDNLGWAGSSVRYNPTADAFDIRTVKKLSMTEDDRVAGEALYGGSSAYADGFDAITLASRMTADYRIKQQFQAVPYDCVILDHNHNDRGGVPGELNPTKITITAIALGATTTITAAGHGLVEGDGVALEVVGLVDLNYAAARVQSVAGDDIVLNIDSTAYGGAFVSGDVVPLDRTTIYGGWQFVIYYTLNCFARFSTATPTIILAGAPLEYTAGLNTPNEVYSMATILKALAAKWGFAFFDIAYELNIPLAQKLVYFPDGTHPTTSAARQAITNYWVRWASGGAVQRTDESQFLLRGTGATDFTNQREALYSKWLNGFGTPSFIVGAETPLITEDFVSIADWTAAGGGAAPTVGIAPWGVDNAMLVSTAASTTSYIWQNAAFTGGTTIEFDFEMPEVSGLVSTAGPFTITLLKLDVGGGPPAGSSIIGLQLLVYSNRCSIRGYYFTPTGALGFFTGSSLLADTKYNIRMEFVKSTAQYLGAALLYVDDVLVGGAYGIDNSLLAGNPGNIAIGHITNNVTGAVQTYVGNLVASSLAVSDYTARGSGTFTSADGKTMVVVNGQITSIV